MEDLSAGDYSYGIECVDVAGNTNSTTVSFSIEVDISGPEISEIYISEGAVYFDHDETVTCEYFPEAFEYGDGTEVSGSFTIDDSISTYYMVCEDDFGNQAAYVINV